MGVDVSQLSVACAGPRQPDPLDLPGDSGAGGGGYVSATSPTTSPTTESASSSTSSSPAASRPITPRLPARAESNSQLLAEVQFKLRSPDAAAAGRWSSGGGGGDDDSDGEELRSAVSVDVDQGGGGDVEDVAGGGGGGGGEGGGGSDVEVESDEEKNNSDSEDEEEEEQEQDDKEVAASPRRKRTSSEITGSEAIEAAFSPRRQAGVQMIRELSQDDAPDKDAVSVKEEFSDDELVTYFSSSDDEDEARPASSAHLVNSDGELVEDAVPEPVAIIPSFSILHTLETLQEGFPGSPASVPSPVAEQNEEAEEPKPETEQERRQRMRRNVVGELLSTEETYVGGLEAVIDVFYLPLMGPGQAASPPWLTQSEITSLFSNIQPISLLNTEFRAELRERIESGGNEDGIIPVGDLLVKFAPHFKLYSMYVRNHEHASNFYQEMRSKPRKYAQALSFFEECKKDSRCNNLNLASLLILPIQRIPRYKLLLEQLLKYTNESEHAEEFDALTKALDEIKQVAVHINEAVRTQQENAKILGLQNEFAGGVTLLKPGRRLVRRGPLTKIGRFSNQHYVFFLFTDMLCYADRSITANGMKYRMRLELPLAQAFRVQKIDGDSEDNAFQVISHRKSFSVRASNTETRDAWLRDIEATVEEQQNLFQRRGSVGGMIDVGAGQKRLVMAPVMQQFTSNSTCCVCKERLTLLDRKHCRACGGTVHSKCSQSRLILAGTHDQIKKRVCDKCQRKLRDSHAKVAAVGQRAPPPPPSRPPRPDALSPENARRLSELVTRSAADASVPAVLDEEQAEELIERAGGPLMNMTDIRVQSICEVLYDFQSDDPKDVVLRKGQRVLVCGKDEPAPIPGESTVAAWWIGFVEGHPPTSLGCFPSNYVRVLREVSQQTDEGNSSD